MKREIIYAFIDAQNLNYGTSKDIVKNKILIYKGWKLDFRKFRIYLKDKFKVSNAFIFIGFTPKNQDLYNSLESYGYKLIFKPTISAHGQLKGNVDAELVLHSAAIEYKNFNKSIIVAGDGDYRCLIEFLKNRNKLLKVIIPNQKSESSLLKPFQKFKIFIQSEKEKLRYTGPKNKK